MLRKYAYRLKKRLTPKLIVLAYHRVIDKPFDPLLTTVSIDNFSEQVKVLSSKYHILSLQSLYNLLSTGSKIPRNSIVLTFDDGYSDNYENAAPILEKFKSPASFFVCNPEITYYWDILESVFFKTEKFTAAQLDVLNYIFEIELDKKFESSKLKRDEFNKIQHWDVLNNTDPHLRCHQYKTLLYHLEYQPHSKRNDILQRIHDTWTLRHSEVMKEKQLRALSNDELFEIGGHTSNHVNLATEELQNVKKEVLSNQEMITSMLGKSPVSFAYPFGSKKHFNKEVKAVVEEVGYSTICANFAGKVYFETSITEIPRFLVRNWNKNEFEGRLRHFLSN